MAALLKPQSPSSPIGSVTLLLVPRTEARPQRPAYAAQVPFFKALRFPLLPSLTQLLVQALPRVAYAAASTKSGEAL